MRILLVDDDEVLMQALADRLIQERYAVDIALDGKTAEEYIQLFKYDLIILDLMLPDGNGIDFCQTFRRLGYENPVLMLTARASTAEKVQALDAGADDYVIKPFDFDELCARVRALLRREHQGLPSVLRWGALQLDPSTCETFFNQTPIHLTPKEFALIELFLRNPSRVYSLDAIIEDLWSFEDPPSEDAVRTHIKGLRHKLKEAGAPKDLIKTVYGLGYRLSPEVPMAEKSTVVPESTVTQTATSLAVAKAWSQYQSTMEERIAVLETTAQALSSGHLSQELHQHGQANAHKLVGALGSFGFSEGSRLARELEQILHHSASLDSQQISRFSDLVQQLRQSIDLSSQDDAIATVAQGAPLLLLISQDSPLAAAIEKAAAVRSIRTQIIDQLDQAPPVLNATPPQLVFLDSHLLNNDYAGLDCLAQAISPETTTLFVMDDNPDLETRLQIVQQGAGQILERSTSPQQLITVAQQALQRSAAGAKVAIVDDDPQVLTLLETSLQPWGFRVITLAGAKRLWEMLETEIPDVLVLDVEMPGINGLELCQILRADPRWQQLPILFLTVHQDEHIRTQAFSAGADDFINKSVATTELATRILNRLKH